MLRTVQGYPVRNLADAHVVSVQEGKEIRQRDLKADKSRQGYGLKLYVNPETYTPEEKAFMEDTNAR